MAFLSSDVPFSPQLQNIAGAVQGPGVTGLQGGQAGQFNLANLLQALSTPSLAGGTGQASDISNILKSIGAPTAEAGAGGTANVAGILASLGIPAATAGLGTLQEAQQIETSGQLPAAAQDIVKQNLDQRIAQIKGKWAQLGQSGSSDEANEIDQATRQSLSDQFTISQSLGGLLGNQALSEASLGFSTAGAGGNLSAVLAQLGLGALTTSGSLGTTLGSLGLTGLQLTQQDYANLANQGLSSLNIEQGIYGNLANTQIAQDTQTTNLLGSFFKALAGNSGAFGTGGFIPGLEGLFGGAAAGPTALGTAETLGEAALLA